MNRTSLVVFAVAVSLTALAATADEKADRLVDAARRGDLAAVKQLVAEAANVNCTIQFNITPLWQASSKGHRDVVELLLEAGADPNIRDEVWKVTPLMLADKSDIVALLIKHGAKGADEKLRTAAISGAKEMVEAIVGATTLDEAALAAAKAQAELGSHAEIARRLDEVAGKELPGPPEIDEAILQTYVGKYASERLEEVELRLRDGQLLFDMSGGSPLRLIPRDERTFEMGPYRFSFETENGDVTAVTQSLTFSTRVYTRVSSAETEIPVPIADTDDLRQDDAVAARDRWPSFRGPAARGIAADQGLPDQWHVPAGTGVRWKTPIPGLANSCPIVWQNKVFVTTAVSSAGNTDVRIGLYGEGDAADDQSEHSWQLYCLERATGRVLWQRVAGEGVPPVKRHLKSSQANPTPATDGRHVVALFNSGGLHCYDMDGELLWEKNLGVLDAGAFNDEDYQWGFGSSPIIYQNSVIVQCDLQSESFLAAFEIGSGKEIWRVSRDEIPSWGTPNVYQTARGPLLITNGTNYVRGYDARSGAELWRLGNNAAITVPTPIVGHDLVYVTSGYRPIQPIYAVRLGASGDITLGEAEDANEHLAWSKDRGGPYLPTPLLYGDYLYTCGNNGVFTCYDAKTGEQVYRRRCGSGEARSFTASPVAADGQIYLTAEAGVVFAIKAGPAFELLSTNPVGEYCLATPAIAGGLFILRTQGHLVAVGAGQ